jgi:hypothetical protein
MTPRRQFAHRGRRCAARQKRREVLLCRHLGQARAGGARMDVDLHTTSPWNQEVKASLSRLFLDHKADAVMHETNLIAVSGESEAGAVVVDGRRRHLA